MKKINLAVVGATGMVGRTFLKVLEENGIRELPAGVEIAHASEVVEICDNPATAFREKKDSSLTVGLNLLKAGEGDAFVSAGSTGALLGAATLLIKPLLVLPFLNGGERIVTRRNTAALVLAFFLSASGYFLAEGLMFGFHTAFLVSVSGSAVQSGGSALAFLAAGGALDRLQVKRRWRAGSRG